MSTERLELADWVIKQAQKNGADQVAVNISNQRQVDIEFRDKKLETLTESTQNSLSVDIYSDHKYSSHSTNDLRRDALQRFIEEAVASTKYLARDEYRALPDPKYYNLNVDIDLKIRDAGYEQIDSSQRVELAEAIEAAAMAQSDKIISTTAGYSDVLYHSVKVHSNGFSGQRQGTSFSAGAEVTVKDPNGGRPEDWFWATGCFRADLPSAESLGTQAAQRALQKIGQEKIASGLYTMVVENRAAGRLLGMLRRPMTARALQQKSSYLEGMLGKQIASDKLTLVDDPFIEKGLGSRLYDGEGMVAQKRTFIDRGVLQHYFIDNYYGKKLGMPPTTSSPSNVLFDYGDRDLEAMIKDVDKGILITGFIGGNSNSTTGDFSFGVTGILVEKGELVKPVNEMNISGNAKDFWNKLSQAGNDPYLYSSWRIPTLVFEDIDFSGI
ncbi:TldD/PmbA family protein [candidate division KSB1 bacterium]|nr:TldD/PmbA family protein [candidate division KSB1 bacterium]RQW00104.1 MAG: TldD/PmbA family protein [candidate division KSB1 bacterium]